MTDQDRTKRPRVRVRLNRESTEAVGYGRPPKASRFKPGVSGNPRGRPKGTKNIAAILEEEMARKLEVRTRDGRINKIPVATGLIKKIVEFALKGNLKAAQFLLNGCAESQKNVPQAEATILEEQLIFDEFLPKYAKKLLENGGKND